MFDLILIPFACVMINTACIDESQMQAVTVVSSAELSGTGIAVLGVDYNAALTECMIRAQALKTTEKVRVGCVSQIRQTIMEPLTAQIEALRLSLVELGIVELEHRMVFDEAISDIELRLLQLEQSQ